MVITLQNPPPSAADIESARQANKKQIAKMRWLKPLVHTAAASIFVIGIWLLCQDYDFLSRDTHLLIQLAVSCIFSAAFIAAVVMVGWAEFRVHDLRDERDWLSPVDRACSEYLLEIISKHSELEVYRKAVALQQRELIKGEEWAMFWFDEAANKRNEKSYEDKKHNAAFNQLYRV